MKFLKNDNTWSLTPDARLDVRDKLPPGNYTVCKHPLTGEYFLEESEAFALPRKLYGKTNRHAERILETFKNRQPDSQVGVFLSGVKGSGKTLLAKQVAVNSGLPVIIVNAPFSDDRFMRTIQGIDQPAVVIFDEFEKLYDRDAQESILTLFDGVYTARNKIMVITCNDKYSVQGFFHNRPSRLRYAIAFNGLETEFIKEYCDDCLKDRSYTEAIIGLSATCDEFNFDMLQVLVDELNRYGGSFEDSVEILNVKPIGFGSKTKWKVSVTTPGSKNRKWEVDSPTEINASPLHMVSSERWDNCISVRIKEQVSKAAKSRRDEDEDYDADDETLYLELRTDHLTRIDPYSGTYVFDIEDYDTKFRVVFTEEVKGRPNYQIGASDF